MECTGKNTAVRHYLVRFAMAMLSYIVLLAAVDLVVRKLRPHAVVLYGVSVLPALPIIAMILIVGIYLREEKDEFQRDLFLQELLWGLGGTMAVTTVWGFLERFAHIVHFQPMWTFPLFWVIAGFSVPFLSRKYR